MSTNKTPDEYYFITAPQDVSWQKNSQTKQINTYGTNAPYLNYGSTGLRSLKLGNAMVEGFSDGKEVENNITELEACMLMTISEDGYAAPFCWNVYAGGKSYGTFILQAVDVKEEMRDMSGKATRAFVDLTLQEVSPLQVNTGIDITSTAIKGSLSQEGERALALQNTSKAAGQDVKVGKAKSPSGTTSGTGAPSNESHGAGGAAQNGTGVGTPNLNTGPNYGTRYTQETGRPVIPNG